MTLLELTKAEGTPEVAQRAGVSVQNLARLRCGHICAPMAIVVDLVVGITALYDVDEDIPGLLDANAARNKNTELAALLAIAKAWPQLDLAVAFRHIGEKRDVREAKKAAGLQETRGRPAG